MKRNPITLYDLAGIDDDLRISPFCWGIKMALAHKQLDYEAVPWRLIEKERVAASKGTTAPVIVDGVVTVGDSWRIAEYLDSTYPDRPLFASEQAKAYCRWIHLWTERVLHPLIVPIILEDVLKAIHPIDIDYFRRTREHAYGKPLTDVCDRSDAAHASLFTATSFVRRMLREAPFISGESPSYGDYILFGAYQWARCCSDAQLFRDQDDPTRLWFARMLGLYDGLGNRALRLSLLPKHHAS